MSGKYDHLANVEVFHESGFWYKIDFYDLTPFSLFRLVDTDDEEIHYVGSNGEADHLCMSYPYENKDGVMAVEILKGEE